MSYSEEQKDIFCAAVQAAIMGVVIRTEGQSLPEPASVVNYARRVVRAAYDDNPKAEVMDFTGVAETELK